MLEIKNVSKSFRRSDGTVKALDGISLEIKEGEFFAVQGKSGSGKTTLLLIAGTILAPDSGEILFNGKKLYSLPLNERTAFRAEKIGFVFQQFHLVPYLTVYENIMLPSLVLKNIGAPQTDNNIQNLLLWMSAENKPTNWANRNNPPDKAAI